MVRETNLKGRKYRDIHSDREFSTNCTTTETLGEENMVCLSKRNRATGTLYGDNIVYSVIE